MSSFVSIASADVQYAIFFLIARCLYDRLHLCSTHLALKYYCHFPQKCKLWLSATIYLHYVFRSNFVELMSFCSVFVESFHVALLIFLQQMYRLLKLLYTTTFWTLKRMDCRMFVHADAVALIIEEKFLDTLHYYNR